MGLDSHRNAGVQKSVYIWHFGKPYLLRGKKDGYIYRIYSCGTGEGIIASNDEHQSHPAVTPIACRGSNSGSNPFSCAFLLTLYSIYCLFTDCLFFSPSRSELGGVVIGGHSGQGNITWFSEMIASRVAVARDMAVDREMTQTLQIRSSEA